MMPAVNNLDIKYRKLLSSRRQESACKDQGTLLLFFAGIAFLYAIVQFSKPVLDYAFYIGVASTITLASLGIIRYDKSNNYVLNRQEKIFFAFYNSYDSLESYLADIQNKNYRERAKYRLERLAIFIDKWTTDLTPKEMSEISNSISEKIHSFSSQLSNDIEEKTRLLKDYLLKAAVFSFNEEPSIKELTELDKYIKTLFPLYPNKVSAVTYVLKQKNKIFEFFRSTKGKLILIGCGFMIYLTLVQFLVPEKFVGQISTISLGGVAIVGLLVYFYHRINKSDSKNSSDFSRDKKSFGVQFSEQFGKARIVEFKFTENMKVGQTTNVYAKIKGSVQHAFLDLLVISPNGKNYWFPDNNASYDSSSDNGKWNFDNDKAQSEWKFNIPNDAEMGTYRAIMGLYENDQANRRCVDYEERTFKVS